MRDILHCDLNSFFASVECVKNPNLKNVPMAVCGDPKLRHGIILAKNELAKSYGIYTPETVYSAKKKCPHLVLVEGNYLEYQKYSKLVNQIYLKYTDRVEPFGIDESFLDITESKNIFGSPVEIAYKIKEEVKSTLGLTISVGISFNKSLAKLGSDMKKPDACTHIPYENFREIIYPLPVNSLLFVGKSTNKILSKMRIYTIGDLARYDKNKLIKKIGKSGIMLHEFANGLELDEVKKWGTKYVPKSFSKGNTFREDICDKEKLIENIRPLVYSVTKSLRESRLKCSVVSISLKNSKFNVINRQKHIWYTDLYQDILKEILDLFYRNYNNESIRAITVAVTGLDNEENGKQLSIFDLENLSQNDKNIKLEKVSKIVDNMYDKYER